MHIPSYNRCRKNGAVPRGTALGLVVAKSAFSAFTASGESCARSLAVIRASCHPALLPCHPERQRRIRPPSLHAVLGEKDGFFGLRPQNDAGAEPRDWGGLARRGPLFQAAGDDLGHLHARRPSLGLVVAKSVFSASTTGGESCVRSPAVIRAPCHPALFPCHPERQRRIRPPLPSRSVGGERRILRPAASE